MLSRFSDRRRRRRAMREMHRRLAELDRLDRMYGVGAMPAAATARRTARRSWRESGPVLPGLLVTALVLGGLVVFSPGDDMRAVRRLLGFDGDRLAAAPAVPAGEGSYAFSMTQRGSREPVGYDPCRPIDLHVNPESAPDGYDDFVRTAIEHTEDATGLRFNHLGETDERDLDLASYPATRRPVLVAWADDSEVPDLAGDVAGIGGSVAVSLAGGRLEYVTGVVVLDEDVFDDVDAETRPHAQAIVDHEFGHLVGLAHVDDPRELMYDDNVGVTSYGAGDLEGLARLGSISC